MDPVCHKQQDATTSNGTWDRHQLEARLTSCAQIAHEITLLLLLVLLLV